MPLGVYTRKSLAERFAAKMGEQDENDCIPWLGTMSPSGYGVFWDGHKLKRAHVVSTTAVKGPPPPDKPYCCHTCDNRWCVNPWHIFFGSAKDNYEDARQKSRQTKVLSGELASQSKITVAAAADIYTSTEPVTILARRYNISKPNVCDIRGRRSWRDVTANLVLGEHSRYKP